MDIIKLLNELDRLIDEQKTVMGLAWNFHPEDYQDLTNKIRASLPEDVKRASRVTAESDKIVDGARETAEQLMRDTEAQVNKVSLASEAAAKQTVEESRQKAEKMLSDAHQQSEKKMADAQQQSELMLSQSEVVRLATAQAREIVASAEQETQSLRLGADEYAHGVMTDLEKQVGELMATIQRGRMKLDQRVGPAAPVHNGLANGNGRAAEMAGTRR